MVVTGPPADRRRGGWGERHRGDGAGLGGDDDERTECTPPDGKGGEDDRGTPGAAWPTSSTS